MTRQVAITGLGLITPLGNDSDTNWKRLIAGESGIGPITQFDSREYKVTIAGEVKDFDPDLCIDKKEARRMDRFTQLGVAAGAQAVEDAGLVRAAYDPSRVGVIVGSGIGGLKTMEQQHQILLEKGPSRVSPFYVPMQIVDITSGYISIIYGFTGPNFATISACATSGHAIAMAFLLIKHGYADVVIAGGSEASVTPIAIAGFSSMKALSTRNDEPVRASRPFDRDRDGFVLSEGAGIVVLEELSMAKQRKAKIYAELSGIGMTADAYHITQPVPEGKGAVASMSNALADSGNTVDQVDYINAHGTSTAFNDKFESQAIKTLFGDLTDRLKISSTKSMTGHMLGATSGVECAYTALAVKRGIIPPTINYDNPDPECDLDYTPNKAVERKIRVALSNSFGFGGHNVTLALRRVDVF